jgi:CDGSH-type Zn-finger protein
MATNSAHKHAGKGEEQKVVVSKNGPYLVSGNIPLYREIIVRDSEGVPINWKEGDKYSHEGSYALCRCGGSKNKPFCDGTHVEKKFNGTEIARNDEYLHRAERLRGPGADLTDDTSLCGRLQYCHRAGGIWGLVGRTDDPDTKSLMAEIAGNCATGRLAAWDKDSGGNDMEPELKKAITVTQDPGRGLSCPLWVKGEIPVFSAEGVPYEVRNRVALCRCGGSKNKPFCDGTHVNIRFKDGDPSL